MTERIKITVVPVSYEIKLKHKHQESGGWSRQTIGLEMFVMKQWLPVPPQFYIYLKWFAKSNPLFQKMVRGPPMEREERNG